MMTNGLRITVEDKQGHRVEGDSTMMAHLMRKIIAVENAERGLIKAFYDMHDRNDR